MPPALPVIGRIQDAIGEILAGVRFPDGVTNGLLWQSTYSDPANWNTPKGPAARPTNIYFAGEPPRFNSGKTIAVVLMDDEDATTLDQTNKTGHVLPWSVQVIIDRHPDQEGAPDLRYIHAQVLAQIKDALTDETNRRLPHSVYGPTVVDNTYVGGGARLVPMDAEANDKGPNRWAFTLNFRAGYRHAPADARTPV